MMEINKIKVITYATHTDEGLAHLKKSLDKFNWDYIVLGLGESWKGFGSKITNTYKYLKTIDKEYTHFIFVDAFDTFFLDNESRFKKKLKVLEQQGLYKGDIIFNGEKACWPDDDRRIDYPQEYEHYIWKYLNSGVYFGNIKFFIDFIDKNPIKDEDYDQRNVTTWYIDNPTILDIDRTCTLFQCLAHTEECEKDGSKVFNKITNTYPVIIHGNGKVGMDWVYDLLNNVPIMSEINTFNINDIIKMCKNTEEYNKWINEQCILNTNNIPQLKELRDYVEQNVYGFGERSFYYMWKCIVESLGDKFTFLEIGVFKGQILALIKMLSNMLNKKSIVIGITPMDTTDGHWESNYEQNIKDLHDKFNLQQPYLLKGLSNNKEVIERISIYTNNFGTIDVVYIDGGHSYEVVKFDLETYSKLVKVNGYLVIDDSCNDLKMPFGYFTGIEDVTRATKEFLDNNENFKFLFNVVHNKVYQRIK